MEPGRLAPRLKSQVCADISINEKTQVLDTKGRVIPGLYAAGEVTSGVHGSNRLGRNALTDLLLFGHIAGQQVTAK